MSHVGLSLPSTYISTLLGDDGGEASEVKTRDPESTTPWVLALPLAESCLPLPWSEARALPAATASLLAVAAGCASFSCRV